MTPTLAWGFLPMAAGLGALHALEPGHAKTLTAAYLIGIRGTWRDAVVLGLSVALTHSAVVIAIAVTGMLAGKALIGPAQHILAMGSAILVVALGLWLLWRRWPRQNTALRLPSQSEVPDRDATGIGHDHAHPHVHGPDQGQLDEGAHACAHAMPGYVARGERPSLLQIIAFGTAGGLIPCPAAISVMLLALGVGETGKGLVLVGGFSIGLALTLVGVGLAVVWGLSRLTGDGSRLTWLSRHAPVISAGVVLMSGIAALLFIFLQTPSVSHP